MDRFSRTELLLGPERSARLRSAFVAVVGLGGVGAPCAEALARCGVGRLLLIDGDRIIPSNINRHPWAVTGTLDVPKVLAGRERILGISPDIRVEARVEFVDETNLRTLLAEKPDVLVDAIDRVDVKVALLEAGWRGGVPVVSSMGAARRCDPSRIRTADLMETKGCPLARKVRLELKARGVGRGILCVYSDEVPAESCEEEGDRDETGRRPLGSLVTVTAAFGLHTASRALDMITAEMERR
ncbi:MAG: tRNA threonylcarbamoyladenosine dehydratase [Elusimicrobia bacterium]|nr:tRNA threonylcarbamoyladenosine dehydratase [Elusimicrobiota bacterium]